MPRFSIIVPTHGVAGRLPLALDSVLDQSFADFELIPVCDGPDSPAGEVAAGYAARDSRVVPVHSPPSDGLSAARNTGIGAAAGTYLLFLDGDDVLAPGALTALEGKLQEEPEEPEEVDVLYFGHERVHWWDVETSTPPLPRTPAGVFTPDRAPQLTGVGLPAAERGLPPGVPPRAAPRLPRGALHGSRLGRPGDGGRRAGGGAARGRRTASAAQAGQSAERTRRAPVRAARPGRPGADPGGRTEAVRGAVAAAVR